MTVFGGAHMRLAATVLMTAATAACPPGGSSSGNNEDPGRVAVLEDHTRANGFYGAPFPSDTLVQANGHVDLTGYPNPYGADLVRAGVELLSGDARGFALTGGVFFSFTDALDPAGVVTLQASTAADVPFILTPVDAQAPGAGQRHLVEAAFQLDAGPQGTRNMLTLLPVQGMPLAPATTYVAAVLRTLRDADGHPLVASSTVAALLSGNTVAGLSAAHVAKWRAGLEALGRMGVAAQDVAGMTVFTTDDPVARMASARADALALGTPRLTQTWRLTDAFDQFCVWEARVGLPVFQQGTPPYTNSGGAWAMDAAGHLVRQTTEEARLWVSLPRAQAPAAGWPLVMMVRTGGGADRPLMDRGLRDAQGQSTPGTGPATFVTSAGFAGLTWDGALGGIRNRTGGDEQFLVFNVFNPPALRDNLRQTALEAILLANSLESYALDPSGCGGAAAAPGATSVGFDTTRVALAGHSMGASIAPLAMAVEPLFSALVLSGAGGSWLENVMYKIKPLTVRPAIEILLSYTEENRQLVSTDPALTLVQWGAEDADAQVFAPAIIKDLRFRTQGAHVLMVQGIVDHYILPNIANALSVPLGLDLAGPALDAQNPELQNQRSLAEMLSWVGRSPQAFPVSQNVTTAAGPVTAAVVQLPEDGVEDGHEVFFQRPESGPLLACFLSTWRQGAPVVGTCP